MKLKLDFLDDIPKLLILAFIGLISIIGVSVYTIIRLSSYIISMM